MIVNQELSPLEKDLNHFSLEKRKQALQEISGSFSGVSQASGVPLHGINLHAHTFFSFNAYGYSPSALAWLARKTGLEYFGIVDFDVLDGVDEFLEACELLGVKGVAGVETRVFIPSYKTVEINSPGEPGIAYHMGIGVTHAALPEAIQAEFSSLREQAARRNQEIVEKLNAYLAPLSLDYERDILPSSPSGNITERHIVRSLVQKAIEELDDLVVFWAEKLSLDADQVEVLLHERIKFENTIRKVLIKRGGIGYVKPAPENFPTIDAFNEIVAGAEAIPCMAWLDGTSEGERDIEKFLGMMIDGGAGAINIIPDRNWNISDGEAKARKVKELNRVVVLADEWQVPVLIGTEMNSYGQLFVDDLNVSELADFKDSFQKGAQFIYGHTRLERVWGLGYQSRWAREHFKSREEKTRFYTEVGRLVPPGVIQKNIQANISSALSPEMILRVMENGRE